MKIISKLTVNVVDNSGREQYFYFSEMPHAVNFQQSVIHSNSTKSAELNLHSVKEGDENEQPNSK